MEGEKNPFVEVGKNRAGGDGEAALRLRTGGGKKGPAPIPEAGGRLGGAPTGDRAARPGPHARGRDGGMDGRRLGSKTVWQDRALLCQRGLLPPPPALPASSNGVHRTNLRVTGRRGEEWERGAFFFFSP